MSRTSLTLEGFELMPLKLTTLPSSMLEGTPKIHFLGLSFHLYLLRTLKVPLRLLIRVLASLVFTTNIVDISFDQVIPYLIMKILLDGTLVCSSDIF